MTIVDGRADSIRLAFIKFLQVTTALLRNEKKYLFFVNINNPTLHFTYLVNVIYVYEYQNSRLKLISLQNASTYTANMARLSRIMEQKEEATIT